MDDPTPGEYEHYLAQTRLALKFLIVGALSVVIGFGLCGLSRSDSGFASFGLFFLCCGSVVFLLALLALVIVTLVHWFRR